MMPKLPTIVDNRNENTALAVLKALLPETRQLDIATGVFDLGSLMALDGFWQKADLVRILMGDETTRRTRSALLDSLARCADASIEARKQEDDALTGLAAIRDALRPEAARIRCRIYAQAKFHAKAYLLKTRALPVNFGLVGSSNFTRPGLTENLELNLLSTEQHQLRALQEWYDEMWGEADDVRAELLRVIQRHLAEHPPFMVYAKALYELLMGREKPQEAWEREDSVIYPMLSQYQKDGYHRALEMADRRNWGGALVCDGVGLGKTYIGLMIIESFIHNRKGILLVVPKSARESVWEARIRRYLRPAYGAKVIRHYVPTLNHTDFGLDATLSKEDLEYYAEVCDAILIDEAHHFRTPHANRSRRMKELCRGKQMFLMTATPVNNSLLDLYHLIDYFAEGRPDHFARIGVNNLRQIFSGPEKLFREAAQRGDWEGLDQVSRFLEETRLFKEILIQRSRKFVMESEKLAAGRPCFPERQKPRVINYSLKNVYATLYGEIKEAFDRENPLVSLAIYKPTAYQREPDPRAAEYQGQVVGLIRTLLLKRVESSFRAFEASTESLLEKMARFLRHYAPERFEAWATTNSRWWGIAQRHIQERLEREEGEEEDDLPEEQRDLDPSTIDMERLLRDTEQDMHELTAILAKLYRRFYARDREGEEVDPTRDEKLQRLLDKLTGEPAPGDPDLRGQKVVIFTEFRDTARYLFHQLRDVAKLEDVEEIDSTRKIDRERVIKRFAPYYNCTPDELGEYVADPVNILISTDVLSEGLNLQDASLLINYDLHWNPVRLMQRIGRVDRRLDPQVEEQLARPPALNGKVFFWNFLPPNELEDLLHLFRRVTGKVLRINAALGIEGALLTPDDPDMTLKEFNQRYEGRQSVEESMRIALQELLAAEPGLEGRLRGLPQRLFSGRRQAQGELPIGIFCCYRLPVAAGPRPAEEAMPLFDGGRPKPETAPGEVLWLYREHATGAVHEGLEDIWRAIRCAPETPRCVAVGPAALKDALRELERDRVRPLLRNRGLPAGAKATLVCWMEVC